MTLPIVDALGNGLVALEQSPEKDVDLASVTCPLSLVVVRAPDGAVLLGRKRWRRVWELPGGVRGPNESARVTAARELVEGTGLEAGFGDLRWVGVAHFALVRPARQERAAVYLAELPARFELTPVDGELLGPAWVDPGAPTPQDASPIDVAIARWAVAALARPCAGPGRRS